MNEEKLRNLGRCAALKTELSVLATRIRSARSTLRMMLDEFADIPELRGDAIMATASDLADGLVRHKEISAKIAAIEKALS